MTERTELKMAKDAFRDNADKSGLGRNSDSWASNMERFRDPVTGKVVPQTPEGKPSPVGTGLNKPSDSEA
jgi:hypothetical protein